MPNSTQELIKENEQLRALCLELEDAVRQLSSQDGKKPSKGGSEAEILLEEKTEVIRGLHAENIELKKMLKGIEAGGAQHGGFEPGVEPSESALDELETKRRALEEEVSRLEKSMGDEEIRLSRERADVARQRYEIDSLRKELEIELNRNVQEGPLKEKIQSIKAKLLGR
ncbi:MAG: hypothetical protein EXR99_00585 [Gemmataceae bacterium]|nr:hypothetical protein [Gemmataceae bacterium]